MAPVGVICPICRSKGRDVRLFLCQLNLSEAMWMCPTDGCPYPIEGGGNDINIWLVNRSFREASDSPQTSMAKGNVSRTPLQRPLPEESSDEADFDPIALLLSDRNSVVSGVSFKRGENQLGPQLLIGDSDSEEEEDERTSVVVPPPQPQVKLEKIYARKPVDQLFARVMEQKRKAAGGASHSKSLLRPAVAFEGYSKSRSTTTSVPSGTASPISSIGEGQKPSTAEDIRTANRRILKQKLAAIKGGKKTSKTVTGDIPAPTNVASPPVANPLPPPPASDHDILDALLNLQPSTSAIADTANVRQPAASTFTSFNDPIDDPMAYLDQPHLVTDDQLEFLSL